MKTKQNILINILYMVAGTALLGACTGVYINVGIGADSITSFVDGFSSFSGISSGLACQLLNVVFLIVTFLLDKKRIGVATVFCALCSGFAIDFTTARFVAPDSLALKIVVDFVNCFFIAFSCALIMKGHLGSTAYDGVTLSIAQALKREYTIIRYVCDGTIMLIGYLFGGEIGIGTIMAVLMVGPIFKWFTKILKCN